MHIFTSVALATALALTAPAAQAFEIGFDWSGLKRCTSGYPNTVLNPKFSLKNVPAGTKYIRFKLVDRNVRGYNHGGGLVVYKGQKTIRPGAFKYQSPCPPSGRHTYEWTATAQKAKRGGKLAVAKSRRKYP
jgi:phosphatidylethanolamine-binding protein (PEBP) family uncharacterized protein